MIGVTISGAAYAAIAATLPAQSAEQEIAPDGAYRVWPARAVVIPLRSLREPGETFSGIIVRLVDRGAYAAITR